ncbi:MAG: NAD(P)-dependent alcohol dehydrogenase [Candidatus Eremiobacteraeota bacterium]|nr:NAD(P)-dependent alcohol dehydrogenase [Candidatus Eremiobacteraeota bacterium]
MMRAAVLERQNVMTMQERQRPVPGPLDVLVRVHRVGVCGSDVHYYTHGRIGSYVVEKPIILGHEMAGIIEDVGSGVDRKRIGERVAVEPGVPDRTCEWCRRGRYNLCPNVVFMATPPYDGALADYVISPSDFAYTLPDNVSLDEGSLMEPLSVAVYAIHRSGIKAGESVAVFGAGPIGLVTVQVARAAGAGVITVIDLEPGRLATAKRLGATTTIDAKNQNAVDTLLESTGGRGVDIVFECAGSPRTARDAVRIAKRGGKVVMIGLPPEDNFPYPLVHAMSREIDIFTVFRYANVYPSAIALVAEGRIDTKSLITHHFPLEKAEDALLLSNSRADGVIKAMVDVA